MPNNLCFKIAKTDRYTDCLDNGSLLIVSRTCTDRIDENLE